MSRTSTISSSSKEGEKADLKINLINSMIAGGKRKPEDTNQVKRRVFERAQ